MHRPPPDEAPRQRLRGWHRSPRSPRAGRAGAGAFAVIASLEGRGNRALLELRFARNDDSAAHPLARSGKWLSRALGRRTRSAPSLTLSRSTSRATSPLARRLLDQAVLRRAQRLGPARRSARRRRSRSRGRAPPPCRPSRRWRCAGLAARDRGGDAGAGDAAVDPDSRSAQPPRAELPLPPAAATRPGTSRSSAWAAGFGMGRPARRAAAARAAAARMRRRRSAARACGPAPGRARPADCRPRGTAARGSAAALPASAPMVLSPSRSSVRVGARRQSRSAATGSGASAARRGRSARKSRAVRLREPRQRPGRGRRRRDRDPRGQAERREPRLAHPRPARASPPNRCATPLTSSRRPSVAVDLDQRRPAPRPARQPLRAAPRRRPDRRASRPAPGRAPGHRSAACPARAPRSAAASVTAWITGPCAPSTISATGASGGASARLPPSARSPGAASQMESDPLHGATLHRPGGQPAGAEQLGVPGRRARRRGSNGLGERRRARHPPAHPRAAQIGACRRAAPASTAPRCRSAATASRRVAVKSSAAGSPHNSPITAHKRGASQALLHRPQRGAGVARLDMDEVATGKPRRIDPPAFEDRHPLLHPQQGLARARPAAAGTRPSRRRAGARRTVRERRRAEPAARQSRKRARPDPLRGMDVLQPAGARNAPPATRESLLATRLATFLFYFCSYTRESAAESSVQLGSRTRGDARRRSPGQPRLG